MWSCRCIVTVCRFLVNKKDAFLEPWFFFPRFAFEKFRYGDVFKSHLFGQPFVVSTNIEVNQFVLQNEGVLFQSCQPISAYKWILGKHTLIETNGDLHLTIRAALVEVINQGKLKTEIFGFLQSIILKRLPSWQDQFVHVQHEATYVSRLLIFYIFKTYDFFVACLICLLFCVHVTRTLIFSSSIIKIPSSYCVVHREMACLNGDSIFCLNLYWGPWHIV